MPYTYKELRENPSLLASLKSPIEFVCDNCGKVFWRSKRTLHASLKRSCRTFCSMRCRGEIQTTQGTTECSCTQCGRTFTKLTSQIRSRKGNNFCSHTCSATWNNLHKTHGTRRSKLEIWLEEQLRAHYPDLEILFNAKEAIDAELDIHFSRLALAFELNGIYHYEPIHGSGKLASIQSNDHRKFSACAERGISLCVVDVSAMKNFKPLKAQHFLGIIIGIVDAEIQRRAAESNG